MSCQQRISARRCRFIGRPLWAARAWGKSQVTSESCSDPSHVATSRSVGSCADSPMSEVQFLKGNGSISW